MKTIKGTYRDNNYFEYEVNGKKYRLEYIHEGTKGGIYIIYWNV